MRGTFKSEKGRDKVRSYYNQVLSQFPFGQRYVETAYGQTFILTAGAELNPPVILLHGSCSNSAFWFPEIMALSNSVRVYAVDIIGEAGNSEEYRPDLDSDDFALWMKNVLTALGVKRTVLVGNSLGGWMALKFATTYPEYVSKLILIAASGLAQVRPQYLVNSGQTQQTDGTASERPAIIEEQSVPKAVLDFINLIVENYNPIGELPIYTDEQLLKLNMPVLFVDGENDVIIDAEKSSQRLSHIIPSAAIRLIPDCGHVVTNSIEHIIPFLMQA